MTTETQELLTDMRAVFGEVYPYRYPEQFQVTVPVLILGVTLRMEMEPLRTRVAKLEAENAALRKLLAPPPMTRDQQLGIHKGPEDCG